MILNQAAVPPCAPVAVVEAAGAGGGGGSFCAGAAVKSAAAGIVSGGAPAALLRCPFEAAGRHEVIDFCSPMFWQPPTIVTTVVTGVIDSRSLMLQRPPRDHDRRHEDDRLSI